MNQRFLIDSHVLIWLLYEPDRIGPRTAKLLTEADEVLVSAVSIWELSLKHNKGKLAYTPQALVEGGALAGLELLPLQPEHSLRLPAITLHHNDPFDAMLLAQNLAEQATFVTADHLILESRQRVRDVSS